jgi:hypothetical protein
VGSHLLFKRTMHAEQQVPLTRISHAHSDLTRLAGIKVSRSRSTNGPLRKQPGCNLGHDSLHRSWSLILKLFTFVVNVMVGVRLAGDGLPWISHLKSTCRVEDGIGFTKRTTDVLKAMFTLDVSAGRKCAQ